MKTTILLHLSKRFLSDKSRRILLTGSLYLLLTDRCERKADFKVLNDELRFLQDERGFLLCGLLTKAWRGEVKKRDFRHIAPPTLERYLRRIAPCWLHYSDQCKYDLDNDVKQIVRIARTMA
ncbi:hypothetical protein [Erwinia phage PhiEaH1]|jgi:hypothetical protein|uniref:Uncharacterized protein n=1 Tax=Erwinia phage PhiEaH1 TaxID=1401669 RepID=W8D0J0_9CAUD|nr:hypothetical protein [Erwinia phage PhiEaH1]AGX01898.1 hypothetical protein [Erwinia phage PhiEaH1]WBF04912.1 hypothetical protein [Erwinia phage vB_Ea277G]